MTHVCCPPQITLCYYDVKDALSIDPAHPEANKLMDLLLARAQTLRMQATQLNLMGRTREALQKISIAIETDPSYADFHILRSVPYHRWDTSSWDIWW